MGAWDEPPPSGGLFGCIGAATGLVLLLTGGGCAVLYLSMGEVIAGMIGVLIAFAGWRMMNAR